MSIFLIFLAAACAPGTGQPPPQEPAGTVAAATTVRELPSPAGPGAGEPGFAADGDLVHMSWLEPLDDDAWALRFATLAGGTWSTPSTIAFSESFFVNWADFPSLLALEDGTLAAHWLQRSGSATYDYDVRIALSADRGTTWGDPLKPHRDDGGGEHGFVSMVPGPGAGLTAVWLDGRETAAASGRADGAMTLRATTMASDGTLGPEQILDPRICDCCQTDAAWIGDRLVVVYRDRSEDEVRDISAVSLGAGGWSKPVPVGADGWMIPGCPVNGPAIAARDETAGVAWFAMVGGAPEVKAAFTRDGGASFGSPVLLERGSEAAATLGRVDAAWLDEHTLIVVWLSAVGDHAEVRYRLIGSDGELGASGLVGTTASSRSSGFPRIVAHDGEVLVAWRVPEEPARIELRAIRAAAATTAAD